MNSKTLTKSTYAEAVDTVLDKPSVDVQTEYEQLKAKVAAAEEASSRAVAKAHRAITTTDKMNSRYNAKLANGYYQELYHQLITFRKEHQITD